MLLYDIYGSDGEFDKAIPLPRNPNRMYRNALACCANGDRRECYVAQGGHWVRINRGEFERRLVSRRLQIR